MKTKPANKLVRVLQRSLVVLILFTAVRSPFAVADELHITSVTSGTNGVAVDWTNSTPGSAFTVQFNSSLAAGIWDNARSRYRWPIPGTRWVETIPSGVQGRYYRVKSEQLPPPNRGRLLNASLLRSISLSQVRQVLAAGGWPSTDPIQAALREYKLDYETVDPYGFPITASGVLFVPQGLTNDLPLLSYQHGTLFMKAAESQDIGSLNLNRFFATEGAVGLLYATSGYVTLMPDYLGLGDSPGYQAYLHSKTEATAVVDMLRASKTFCASNGIPFNSQLFLAGYSQGGHATLAADREIETYHSGEFTITASAPMAGPYDLAGTTLDYLLASSDYPGSAFIAQCLAAYLPIYHLADTLEELFAAPFNRTVVTLLDGQHGFAEVQAACPTSPFAILRADYLASLRNNPTDPIRLAFRENDLYEWTPRSPIRLYHCLEDEIVPYANALVAYQSFTNRGACCVEIVDPGPTGAGHAYCQPFLDSKAWFNGLRR